MFASGNGGLVNDNCNFDGYANSIYTLTVGMFNTARLLVSEQASGSHSYSSQQKMENNHILWWLSGV